MGVAYRDTRPNCRPELIVTPWAVALRRCNPDDAPHLDDIEAFEKCKADHEAVVAAKAAKQCAGSETTPTNPVEWARNNRSRFTTCHVCERRGVRVRTASKIRSHA
jgi:hypothetical protein